MDNNMCKRPFVQGLTYATAADGALGPSINTLTAWAFTSTARVVTLPAAAVGGRVAIQLSTLLTGTGAITVNCAGSDVWRTGSLIESRAANLVTYDTSTVGETQLVLTPTANNCYFDLGSVLLFTCMSGGVWDVEFMTQPDPAGTGLTGTAAWAT